MSGFLLLECLFWFCFTAKASGGGGAGLGMLLMLLPILGWQRRRSALGKSLNGLYLSGIIDKIFHFC
jgi:hypothetical protein